MVEQPLTNAVFNTSFNPPLATPLTFTGSIRLDNAISIATAAGLAPVTVDHNYQDSNVQSWNLNVQHEVIRDLMVMLGYFGSKGTHLRMTRNINQPINGVRPYVRLSDASPELPNTPLGNIIQVESNGNSSYNAMWLAVTKRFSQGLQIDASYTLSKSLDYNSLSSPPQVVTFQDSYNVRNDHGLSDFDARHRFVFSLIYQLPFKGNRFAEGWQIGAIAQSQTGNPVNIVTSNATLNGVANTVRPDVIAPIQMTRTVDQWFNPTSFAAVNRFGNLGRNVLIGPGFANLDMSVLKNTRLNERFTAQFRFEVFDVFNNANLVSPDGSSEVLEFLGSQTRGFPLAIRARPANCNLRPSLSFSELEKASQHAAALFQSVEGRNDPISDIRFDRSVTWPRGKSSREPCIACCVELRRDIGNENNLAGCAIKFSGDRVIAFRITLRADVSVEV
jgi:hypothetical protein